MKGLRKYLTPFAPDQSGAVSMCYALGGMVVIVDAGGCAGNICGFDEPRWQPDYLSTFNGRDAAMEAAPHVEAVFSAGLRDMDAILGRDDLLIKKVEEASKKIDANFIALVGTPVPAVIGTDLFADASILRKALHLPCIAVPTDGMHLYDKGIEQTLLALMKEFASERPAGARQDSRICSVLGLNPLDLFDPSWTAAIRTSLLEQGYEEVLLPGMDPGVDALRKCPLSVCNYVVSPAGIEAAEYLKKQYGTPYEITFPADPMILLEENPVCEAASYGPDTRILVVHQQVLANAIRRRLTEAGMQGKITAASWFEMRDDLAQDTDVRLKEEDDFTTLVREGNWDLIIADPTLRPMAADWKGKWIDAFHFAVSGQAAIDRIRKKREESGRITG